MTGRKVAAFMADRKADVILLPGDQIVIPRVPNTVAVVGNVINEGLIKYEEGRRLSYYLSRAGGVAEETEAIVLSQASGATFRVRRGLIPGNPVVDDGATIRVIRKPPKDPEARVDVGNVIKDSLAIVASAVTVIAITIKALE